MEAHIDMTQSENEKFLTVLLDKTIQKLNATSNQVLILETQLKFAQDKLKEMIQTNDSTSQQTESN